jgi:hypothetical protein
MKHFSLPIVTITVSLLLMPLSALAHQQEVFKIGDKTYSVEIGSLVEPAIVDYPNGVFFSVSLASEDEAEETEAAADHHEGENTVEGLEKTLKAEVSAGDKKKVMDVQPIRGQPGQYQALFIPTIQTTLTYRIFGTIDNVPVDLSFTCNPAGHPVSEEDKAATPMGENVTRILKKGAFGCPAAKADLGFPEAAPSLYELSSEQGMNWGLIGAVLGALGLVAGGGAWMKASKR